MGLAIFVDGGTMTSDGKRAGVKSGQTVALRAVIVVLAVALIVVLCLLLRTCSADNQETAASAPQMEQTQGSYVKPETPVDRSKNVTLPGWGGFTIPANEQHVTQGFEFHNPAENIWYEDYFSVNDTEASEKLVVDSGDKMGLNHLLGLLGVKGSVTEVADCGADSFALDKNDQGSFEIEGIAGFEGEKTIVVKTDAGESVSIDVRCEQQCYYMTFGLYLADGDELLYQSGLVSPGNYVQDMQMTRALAPGTYDAYVVCQPYRSDGVTKTNQGVVKITLTAK